MNGPATAAQPAIEYPEQDGNPMSDNTLQFRWITTLQGGFDDLFRGNPAVFVAGDLLWYPVEGDNTIRQAPATMIVFGRPKGDRGSYRQWEEDNVPPQVVFEVMSPENRPAEMARKLLFYERYGVEEYYVYDPDRVRLTGYRRASDGGFEAIPEMDGFVSPRLGVRFDLSGEELVVHRPDGRRFLSYLEQGERAERERLRAEQAEQRAAAAEAESARLRAALRAAGLDPDAAPR